MATINSFGDTIIHHILGIKEGLCLFHGYFPIGPNPGPTFDIYTYKPTSLFLTFLIIKLSPPQDICLSYQNPIWYNQL